MKTTLIILVSVLIAHCSHKNSNNSNGSQAAVNSSTTISTAVNSADPLTGKTFKSTCVDNETFVDTFANGTETRVDSNYNDNECQNLNYVLNVTRSYVIGQNKEDIDYTWQKLQMTIKDQAFLDECNQAQCYGFSDWALNVAKDIGGLQSDSSTEAAPKIGDKLYQIFKLDGSELVYGDSSIQGFDGTTASSRPTTFDGIVFIKQ